MVRPKKHAEDPHEQEIRELRESMKRHQQLQEDARQIKELADKFWELWKSKGFPDIPHRICWLDVNFVSGHSKFLTLIGYHTGPEGRSSLSGEKETIRLVMDESRPKRLLQVYERGGYTSCKTEDIESWIQRFGSYELRENLTKYAAALNGFNLQQSSDTPITIETPSPGTTTENEQ
jgi:hypothetical protein